ncbi:microtubule-associated protein futsch-like [Galleria mellonella]|uniref:Microtubule-associated protein futsch-like n=1 Tax=Galleria mellonella TaxID=7137 RepID=A0A6J1WI80_GALME|nr:microtubule-associated protein futsch-like [Galleria mellonella]
MNEEKNEENITLTIPIIKAESETQTSGQLVSKSPSNSKTTEIEMESEQKQNMSIRKRRNLSKNRTQAARQREKTPEPGRTPIHEDTTTSDDEDNLPQRNSREIEADNTYEEMKRLVQEKASVKDPVYDLDTDEVLEARAIAANERRRRSISPFALPDKIEEDTKLERKGSFIDPTNKLLSTNYTLNLKDEDKSRRNSLTMEMPIERRSSLSPPISTNTTSKESDFIYPTTPKKLEEIVYPDEKKPDDKHRKLKTPVKNEEVFTFDDKDIKTNAKITTPKTPETPITPGEIVTKVIQVERTPSKKTTADKKPVVEVRERIVRTPSRKMSSDVKPVIVRQQVSKPKEDQQSKVPPVKPARSKSATRFGSKTSESEMSEDQAKQQKSNAPESKRKIVPTPRRFMKNRSPRAKRSQSANRIESIQVVDKSGIGMSQTSREIIELMQIARARSLSIPKDDPRLPSEYKDYKKNLQTPTKTPSTPRQSRGISCPKTIQIISDKEILSGLTTNQRINIEHEKRSRRSSGYIDASQSEYTSSCYSTSPSENEFDFDLSEKTAELTRKLNILSQEVDDRNTLSNILLANDNFDQVKTEPQLIQKPITRKKSLIDNELEISDQIKMDNQKSTLRKRSLTDNKAIIKKEPIAPEVQNSIKSKTDENKKEVQFKWKIIRNWQQFKQEYAADYTKIKLLRNRCISDLLLLIIMCGLGGMMFRALEGSFENAYKCGTRGVKRDFIENLWRGSHYLREEDWKSMARKKLYEFENQLHTAHEAGVTSYSGQKSWNFMNSFVYCLTLITTIGYGHIAPKTRYGQAATIVYAIIGIPLFLIVLADFGKLFTRIIKFFWAFIRRFYYTRSCRKVRRTAPVQEVMKGLNIVYEVVRRPSQIFNEDEIRDHPNGDHEGKDTQAPTVERKPSDIPPPLPPKPGTVQDIDVETDLGTPAPSVFEIDDEFNLPVTVAVFILIIYIFIGAVCYSMWEDWDFFKSFYFVFISMSTIGLGDVVPDHPIFMMSSILYLIFGLAFTSMCINVVQVKLTNTFKHASAKLGATIGLQVSDEDGSLVTTTPVPLEIVPVHKPRNELPPQESKSKEENEQKNR